MDDHRNGVASQPDTRRQGYVIELVDIPDLDEMISTADRAKLRTTTLERSLTDQIKIGPRQHPTFLDVIEIGGLAKSALNGPGSTATRHPTCV